MEVPSPPPRIERIPEGVAEEVEAEDCQPESDRRGDHEEWLGAPVAGAHGVVDDGAPGGHGGLDTDAEK